MTYEELSDAFPYIFSADDVLTQYGPLKTLFEGSKFFAPNVYGSDLMKDQHHMDESFWHPNGRISHGIQWDMRRVGPFVRRVIFHLDKQ